MTAASENLGRDVQVTGWVGLAHFFSHFYQLVLPPIFPLLKSAFGVSYTELGLMMALFYITSGLSQTLSGFLVDRFGAHRILVLGLGLLSASVLLMGLAPSFLVLLPLVMLAGVGNSVFHPADYAILTNKVTSSRLARAYSVHTLGGTLGWAAAPAAMIGLSALLDWRAALLIAGSVGLLVVLGLLTQRHAMLLDRAPAPMVAAGRLAAAKANLNILFAAPVVLCFSYFALLSLSTTGIQTFLPTALFRLHGTPLTVGSVALTAFLIGSAVGILVGGVLADRTADHERIVAGGLAGAAVLVFTLGQWAPAPAVIIGIMALAGFLSGTTLPSRDMLVRSATPRGSAGKVFGFVYSGLDLGAALAPILIGVLLDGGRPRGVFAFTAGALAVTVLSALVVKRSTLVGTAPAE